MKTGEIMFRKTFCPKKCLCFLARKSHSIMLQGWLRGVSYFLRFTTIHHCSHYSLFANIRYSGFPDTTFISIPLPCLYVCVGLGDNKIIMWCKWKFWQGQSVNWISLGIFRCWILLHSAVSTLAFFPHQLSLV